ncbi:MAG: methyltransferase domain-containing protein [Deltaproteobacteria bacterium]|nr:methyltransferase domain-containing protein [Deltaproteobacteria bacterium]
MSPRLRFRCDACPSERLVPFSCKARAVCPSCGGCRMAERAAHLADHVLPVVPIRQWVLSLPFRLRYALASNHQRRLRARRRRRLPLRAGRPAEQCIQVRRDQLRGLPRSSNPSYLPHGWWCRFRDAMSLGQSVASVWGVATRISTDVSTHSFGAARNGRTMGVVSLLRHGKGPMDGWIARAYDRGIQAAFRDLFPTLVQDVLQDLSSARRVLDAGCGPGQFTIMFAELVPTMEVWGIDLAPTMIELARAHAADSPARERLHFEVADVARLPFPDRHFDAVISSGSIKHWPDPVAGLRELHRVLAPGGRAFIGEMNRMAPPQAVATQRKRLRHWLFRLIYPRIFTKALTPDEARTVFGSSPFGPPARERLLLDGCFWMFEVRKAEGC